MGRLEGKVVLVTGGARGIGAAIVRACVEEGARVVVNYAHSADAAKALCDELGESAVPEHADVSDSAAVEGMIERVLERFGAIDVLVNNAGITRDNLVAAMSDEEWEEVLRTNVGGAFRVARAVARPMMSRRQGRIVNLSSVAATRGGRGQANYAASKGAIEAFTRSLAVELAPKKITVNAVSPGVIDTEMSAFVRENAGEQILAHIPLKRYGTVDDVAHAVLFLASDEAAYVTGAVLPVDGGFRG